MDRDSILQKLEDESAIRKLQAAYGHYCDHGWAGKKMDCDKAAECFTEDATWESVDQGILAKGREEIRKTFQYLEANSEYFMHGFIRPLLDINGNSATGRWIMLLGCVVEGKSSLIATSYEIEYAKTADGWRFKAVKIYLAKGV